MYIDLDGHNFIDLTNNAADKIRKENIDILVSGNKKNRNNLKHTSDNNMQCLKHRQMSKQEIPNRI